MSPKSPRTVHALLVAAAALFAIGGRTLVRAGADEPLDLVPSSALICWSGKALPETVPPGSQPSALQTLLDLGTRLASGPLDARGQMLIRGFEAISLMVRYPYALALLDARAKPTENRTDKQVDQLEMVLVVRTGGSSEAFLRIIQKVVNEQTDSSAATLRRLKAGEWEYQELHDKRLPGWCAVAWGQIGPHFVLSLGDDVWPRVAETAAGGKPPLSADPWLRKAREAHREDALIEITADATTLRRRLDPFLEGRVSDFFRAWDADELERGHWALGFRGRALFCDAHLRLGGKDVRRLFADPAIDDQRLTGTIPPAARYAIYHYPMGEFFPRFLGGWMATRGPGYRKSLMHLWEQAQARRHFNAQHDVLDHLGDYVVLHNQPPHPLRLPLAMTALIEIRDEPQIVRPAIDKICEAWGEAVLKDQSPLAARITRDADGVWSLSFGPIVGPAWLTTDQFLVISWSPTALRAYVEEAGASLGKR